MKYFENECVTTGGYYKRYLLNKLLKPIPAVSSASLATYELFYFASNLVKVLYINSEKNISRIWEVSIKLLDIIAGKSSWLYQSRKPYLLSNNFRTICIEKN